MTAGAGRDLQSGAVRVRAVKIHKLWDKKYKRKESKPRKSNNYLGKGYF